MKCNNCGYENIEEARFCGRCGADLQKSAFSVNNDILEEDGGKKKKAKKNVILLVVVAVIVAVAAAAYFALYIQPVKKYENAVTTGQKYMEEENYEEAIASFEKAIAIEPKKVETYRQLAKAYQAVDDAPSVEKTYERVRKVISEEYDDTAEVLADSFALYKDAITYYGKKGDTDKVKSLADEAVKILQDKQEVSEIQELKDFYLMNWGYYNKLEELEQTYGEGNVKKEVWNNPFYAFEGQQNCYHLEGLCFAQLIDFNKDGKEELLVAYLNPDGDPTSYLDYAYTEEVYEYKNDTVEKVFEGTCFIWDVEATSEIHVLSKDNEEYIVDGVVGNEVDYTIYGYKDDSFEQVKSIVADGESCLIDGTEVDMDQWNEVHDEWLSETENLQVYRLNANYEAKKESLESTLEELKTTFETLCNRLEIENDSLEETTSENDTDDETTASETVELMDQSTFEQYTGENTVEYLVDDYDGNGTNEAFAITGEDVGEEGVSDAKIYFVSADNAIQEVKDVEYGYFSETVEEDSSKFIIWEKWGGGSGSTSYVFGVKDGNYYELNISGQYMDFRKDGDTYYATTGDHSKGYHDYIDHTLSYDKTTKEFIEQ
jgi:tetratricopeptide (TPR) repeat protein